MGFSTPSYSSVAWKLFVILWVGNPRLKRPHGQRATPVECVMHQLVLAFGIWLVSRLTPHRSCYVWDVILDYFFFFFLRKRKKEKGEKILLEVGLPILLLAFRYQSTYLQLFWNCRGNVPLVWAVMEILAVSGALQKVIWCALWCTWVATCSTHHSGQLQMHLCPLVMLTISHCKGSDLGRCLLWFAVKQVLMFINVMW